MIWLIHVISGFTFFFCCGWILADTYGWIETKVKQHREKNEGT